MSKCTNKSKKKNKTKLLKSQPKVIDFDTWFYIATQQNNVRKDQSREIKVFFASKGLKYIEQKSIFDEMLKFY